jgi:hypothetical protein
MGNRTTFKHVWWLFVVFIVSCGFTHLIEVIATWYPAERLAGLVKIFCAIVSWITVFILWKITPQILKTPQELEELKAKTIELEQVTKRLKQSEAELLEQHCQKDHFLAMLAHELRNPLAPIRTITYIINEKYADRLDEEFVKMNTMINRQVSHLSHMIDDLLDVARINRGMIKINMSSTSVLKAIQGAYIVLESHQLTSGHKFKTTCDPTIHVMADSTRLEQILTNLIHNAIKYTNQENEIQINVSSEHELVCISVCDTGCGIDEKDIPKIYDAFYQSDNTLERTGGGLGLGLAIVKQMMDLHDAVIKVDSKVGEGTKFHLFFQASPLDIDDDRLQHMAGTPGQNSEKPSSKTP